jgi:hypothetical protein
VTVVPISPDELEVAKVKGIESAKEIPLGSGESEGARAAGVVPTLLFGGPAAEGMAMVVVEDTGAISIVSLVEIDISLGPPLDVVVISRGFPLVVATASVDEGAGIGVSGGSVDVKVKVGVEVVVVGVSEVRDTSTWSVVAAKGTSDVEITGLRTSSPSVDSTSTTPSASFPCEVEVLEGVGVAERSSRIKFLPSGVNDGILDPGVDV